MIHLSLAAEPIFALGSWPVTNSLISAWAATLLLLVITGLIHRLHLVPGRVQNVVEMTLEASLNFCDQVTRSREKSERFLPIVGTFFLFILLSNWMGLLPGVGSLGIWRLTADGREFIPLFRPATSDLNFTLAAACLSVIGSHLIGIASLGFFRHAGKFIQLGKIWQAVKTFKPMNLLIAMVEFLVGLIEISSEFAKILSLSLRLFGNIFAGEVLMTVLSSLIAVGLPLPFIAMELVVGVVQAMVFSTLTLVYLTSMSEPPHGEGHHKQEASMHPLAQPAVASGH